MKSEKRMPPPFLKELRAVRQGQPTDAFPFNLPLMGNELRIRFTTPITFLVGENGSGKSTLLEAIARHCGFAVSGGSRDHVSAGDAQDGSLAEAFRLSWLPKVNNGFFFRAESYFDFTGYIDEMTERWPMMEQSYGERRLRQQSHGESFLALFNNRLGSHSRAFYVLDEPETALSPRRQLEFLKIIHRWHRSGQVQAIIATHSPIIMSYPEATLLQIEGGRISQVPLSETDHYRLTLSFLADPQTALDELLAQDGDD